ncbi:MAG: P-loop NTPase fold protein [Muribaculum sp.]|nr:P-loop NTPase fold protein [Muribaculum sp.]
MKTLLPRILTKKDDPDSYKAVEELDEVLLKAEEKSIRNIALTGPYGSGKSSVLNTLKHDFKENRNYLCISLATLQSGNETKEVNGNDQTTEEIQREDVLNRKIEYSILQQLIYREKASTVPNSRFKRITYFTQKELWRLVFWTIGFIIAFFVAFEPTFARVNSAYEWLNFGKINAIFDFIAMGYMLFCLAYVLRYFVQGYSNSKLNKLNLKDGEIDIKEDNSIFNKHLDEILYFFRATDYNVVIIEDLDRFATSEIYLKLRELNQLINESKEVGRHITFVYAVRDDIFANEDRTKFFDYIITVIPVINPSNSKDILKKQLSEIGLHDNTITDDNLAAIAFFIPDMRILTNIVNEFQQYREKLSKTDQTLNMTKLLAMIVYKNYYPKDFASLHKREGMVYDCISRKQDFIKIAIKELEDEKKLCLKEIEQDKEARRFSITELRKLFVSDLIQSLNSRAYSISVKNSQRCINELISDDIFAELLKLERITYEFRIYNNYRDVTTNTTSVNVMSRYTSSAYYNRIQRLSQDDELLPKRLEGINCQLRNVSGLPLYKLISDFKQVRESDIYMGLGLPKMIKVFFIEGFIDEYYYDYISYFYEGMISPADREFILSIRQLHSPEYNRHIDKIDNFIKELRPNNFISDSILNIELLDYFTFNKSRDSKLSDFFNRMNDVIDRSDNKYDFLSEYCLASKSPGTFFSAFYDTRISEVWDSVIVLLNVEKRTNLINSLLNFGGNLNKSIFDWVNANYSFVEEQYERIDEGRLKFIVGNAMFSNLQIGNSTLLKLIMSKCSYLITKDNLLVVISTIYDRPEYTTDDITLDIIRNSNAEDIIVYLLDEDNLSTTFDCLNHNYKSESLDSIEFILKSNLAAEQKLNFLKGQECRRENVTGLSEEQALMMYECNLIAPTWDNVSILLEKAGSNTSLVINYIKVNCESLSAENSASGINKEVELFDLLFGSNDYLTLEEYKSLDKAFECEVEGDNYLKTLSRNRFEVLLNNRKIPFVKENLAVLTGTAYLSSYLLFWSENFIDNLDWDYSLTADDCRNLLKSDTFSIEEKFLIIRKAQYSIILNSTALSDIVISILSKNVDGIPYNIAELRSLIKQCSVLEPKKIIANHILQSLDYHETDFEDVLQTIGEPFTTIAERRKKPKIEKSVSNIELLNTLKKKGFISSVTDDGDYLRPNYFKS